MYPFISVQREESKRVKEKTKTSEAFNKNDNRK
jgi:hypothetical protein